MLTLARLQNLWQLFPSELPKIELDLSQRHYLWLAKFSRPFELWYRQDELA